MIRSNTRIIWWKPNSPSRFEMKVFLAFALLLFAFAGELVASSLDVMVRNDKGAVVPDAVVYAEAAGARSGPASKRIIIDQRDRQFVPYVTALQVGAAVLFPNSDNIRHHVYSFSPAKKFELPLYTGVPAEPVVFDKVGFVTLGCNIHDWMIAYVAVLPTPYFQITGKEGHALVRDLPAGQYTVRAWHPALKGQPEAFAQHADISGGGAKDLSFTLPLKPDVRARQAPGLATGGYR